MGFLDDPKPGERDPVALFGRIGFGLLMFGALALWVWYLWPARD